MNSNCCLFKNVSKGRNSHHHAYATDKAVKHVTNMYTACLLRRNAALLAELEGVRVAHGPQAHSKRPRALLGKL